MPLFPKRSRQQRKAEDRAEGSLAALRTRQIAIQACLRRDGARFEDELVRAKGIMDGAATLAEAAKMVRSFAMYLQGLHSAGNVLRHPVKDDYAFYYKP